MKRSAAVLVPLFFVSAAVLFGGCGGDAQSAPSEDQEKEAAALPVETAAVESGAISAMFAGTATLEAEEESDVAARAGGIVKSILVEEGDRVSVGQILAHLDDERLALELARAEAALARLESDHTRSLELFEKKLIASEEYERVKADFETQRAATDLARLSVEQTTVRSPISGVVSVRMVKVGNMVQTHQATFRVTSFDRLLAVMYVPERELPRLRVGQPARVRVDALPGVDVTGRIARISPVVDASTGTFKVTVAIRDPSARLKPGMFGRIGIVYETHENATLVPKSAVLAEDDEASVFVVRGDTAYRQIVRRGFENERFVEVVEGVSPGMSVITTGQANLRDSSRVEVIR